MEEESFDKDLARKVQSSLVDSASVYENQTQEIGWSHIMEESNNRSRRISRRTQLLSTAAALVLVLGITAGVVALVQTNADTSHTASQKNDPLTVTTLAPPQSITGDAPSSIRDHIYIVKEVKQPAANTVVLDVYDGATSARITTLPQITTSDADPARFHFLNNASKIAVFRTKPQCDASDSTFEYDPSTGSVTSRGSVERIYSPNKTSYAEIGIGCTNSSGNITVVNSATGTTQVIKEEVFADQKPFKVEITADLRESFTPDELERFDQPVIPGESPVVIKWINETTVAVQTMTVTEKKKDGELAWKVIDLTKDISLKNAPLVSALLKGNSKTHFDVADFKTFKGTTYALFTKTIHDKSASITQQYIGIVDITHQEKVWMDSIDIKTQSLVTNQLFFGNSTNVVVGSAFGGSPDQRGWYYDHSLKKSGFIDGMLLLPKE
ncbi:MAG TPA: hypothetical protein PKB15_02110 [Acidimicrobiia bacterium]|nr:hypothetical protein [Acidimicrobiia bacterium]